LLLGGLCTKSSSNVIDTSSDTRHQP
jgi:hypothetical protein